ncbi:MAG: toprim domain-containing protein [Dehalococcoidia bacterium]|jgi:DNA primase
MPGRAFPKEMVDYRELTERLDLRDFVAPPGKRVPSGARPLMINCIYHDDHHASLGIWPDHLHCFGCGAHKSTLDFLAEENKLDIKNDFRGTVEVLTARYMTGNLPPPRPRVLPRKEPKELKPMNSVIAQRYHDNLKEKRQWFCQRTLSDRIIDGQLLGYDGRAFTIPVWDPSGQLLTIRFRRDDSLGTQGPKYYGIEGRNQTFLYNQGALTGSRYVVICEGELDTLVLWQEGIPAVSSTNGCAGMASIWEEVKAFFRCEHILIAFDQDEEGRKQAVKLLRIINGTSRYQGRKRAVALRWDKRLGKDITELAQKKGIGYVREMI